MAVLYDNGIVKIDQCSETLYTLCFEPAMYSLTPGSASAKALEELCDKEVLLSHRAVAFEMRHLDSGILTALHNPQITTADYKIRDSLIKIADAIARART